MGVAEDTGGLLGGAVMGCMTDSRPPLCPSGHMPCLVSHDVYSSNVTCLVNRFAIKSVASQVLGFLTAGQKAEADRASGAHRQLCSPSQLLCDPTLGDIF